MTMGVQDGELVRGGDLCCPDHQLRVGRPDVIGVNPSALCRRAVASPGRPKTCSPVNRATCRLLIERDDRRIRSLLAMGGAARWASGS